MNCRYWVFNGAGNNREVHGTRKESAREGALFFVGGPLFARRPTGKAGPEGVSGFKINLTNSPARVTLAEEGTRERTSEVESDPPGVRTLAGGVRRRQVMRPYVFEAEFTMGRGFQTHREEAP